MKRTQVSPSSGAGNGSLKEGCYSQEAGRFCSAIRGSDGRGKEGRRHRNMRDAYLMVNKRILMPCGYQAMASK
jgi:hypothetical protein